MPAIPLQTGEKARNFTFITPWRSPADFYDDTEGKAAVLFFLRYYGCTTCQLKIHHLMQAFPQYEEANARLYVVLQSTPETIRSEVAQNDIPFQIICDESQELYRLYAIGSRDPQAPRLPVQEQAREQAKALGLTHGAYEGNELQLPATFVFDRFHNTVFSYYGKDSADTPDTSQLLPLLQKL